MKSQALRMREGPEAFNRFHKAMEAIVSVPKSDVIEPSKPPKRKKKSALQNS